MVVGYPKGLPEENEAKRDRTALHCSLAYFLVLSAKVSMNKLYIWLNSLYASDAV